MRNLNPLLIIFSIVANVNSVGDKENGFDRKLFDFGLESCIENFDVHVDKIIRTQDSRAMGAKYLNEAEVDGRDECMKLCCETSSCDVFVYEQKIPGSCYLFHCGSPEDFKCKFTQHKNYTSAVLAMNRIGELENRMKFIKHEEELTKLRKLDHSLETTPLPSSSTKVPVLLAQTKNETQKSKCSRYQFECKEIGECIAVYNACDGIPQCSDGSDEAPELDCPTISGLTHPKTFHDQLKNLKTTIKNSFQEGYISESTASPEIVQQLKQPIVRPQSHQRQQQKALPLNYFPNSYSRQKEHIREPNQTKLELPQQMASQPKYYGREGEIMQYPMGGVRWQGYQPQKQEEGNNILNHKDSGIVPESPDSQISVPFNNEGSHADYMKYAAAAASNNGYYSNSIPVYYPGPNGWMHRYPQQSRGLEDIPQRPMQSMYGNVMSGPLLSDYYYEDSQLRGRYQVPQDPRKSHNSDSYYYSNQKNNYPKQLETLEILKENSKENIPKKTESVKKILDYSLATTAEISLKQNATVIIATTTVKPNRPHPTSGVAEHLKLSESNMKDVDGINQKPSGAILSLTLGMCITAIMITLVGCRLRVVRKKMRRNGKSPLAHDSDFLVNGMYL